LEKRKGQKTTRLFRRDENATTNKRSQDVAKRNEGEGAKKGQKTESNFPTKNGGNSN